MKWIQFSRKFNFVPAKQSAVTMQFAKGAIEGVTDEAAAKAIANGAGIEVEAPANAEEAAAMRAGTVAVRPVKVAKADEKPTTPPAGDASTAGKAGKAS